MNTNITKEVSVARHSAVRAAWTFALALALLAPTAFAATTWDANTGTTGAQDGGGTWDTTTANWWNGTADVVWPNTTSTTATIGAASGAAGTINVSGTVILNQISIAAAGSGSYTLSGGTLSFGGTTPTISIAASLTPTINSVIGEGSAGTAIKFTATGIGSGSITLGGANTFTGSPTIAQATVNFNSLANGGSASSFGAGANTVPVIVGNSGSAAAATYTGPAASTDRPWTVNGAATGNTINNNGSGAVSFNNTGSALGGTAGNRTLTLQGSYTASANTFAELLSDMTGGFTTTMKIGGNTWNITGANTHSGGTTLNSGGVMNIGNASALGSGPFTQAANGFFDNTTGGDITVANAFTLSGGSPSYLGSANNMTLNGPVTLSGANRTITVTAKTLTLGGQITGAFTLTKAGAGTLTLNNSGSADTHNGTLVNAGTLDLGGASQALGAVTFSGASTTQNGTINAASYSGTLGSGIATVSANLAGSGVALSHSGSGTLALFGLNTYSGGTTISGSGTLMITNDAALGNASGGLTFSGNGILAATNNAAPVTNAVTIGSSRTITVNSGITANFYTPDTNNLTIAAKITGAGNVTKKSSSFSIGTVRFSNDASDYTGDFLAGFGNTEFTSVADQGTPSSLGAGAVGTGGQITLGNASSSGTLRYVGAANSSTHRPLIWTATTASGYTLDASGGGTVQFLATGTMRSGSGGATALILRGSNTGANTLAEVIADLSGATSLTKNDAGTWVLTGANTFSGGVSLVGGVLQLNAAETPGTSGPLGTNGTIYLLGGTLRYTAADTADYSSRFCTTNNQLCKIDCNGQSVSFATPLTSSGGSLAVSSSAPGGSLTLFAANTYSGSTTVNGGGTLLVNGSVAGGGVTVTGGTLGGSGAINSAVSVQPGGTLQPGPGGTNIATLTINSSLTLAGNTVMLLNRTNAQTASLITGISSLTNGGTLTITNFGDALQAGDTFTLFSAANYIGSFAVTNLPSLSSGLVWDLSKLAQNGTITVGQVPTITAAPTSQVVECSGNATFTVAGIGYPAPTFQWSVNGSPASGATATSFTTNNVHGAGSVYAISVTAANAFGSVTSNATLTVQDTLAPAITLNGSNPMTVECHSSFTDPGATALDACVGPVTPMASGSVNPNSPGSYTLTYTANDGNGNIATATRTVNVVDTTAPVVNWSFTNLTLSADTNCQALMPDVTGTNYILAADACSSVLTITQTPTNNAVLALGTNEVVLAVADGNGNTAYSTNTVVVADTTPPVITLLGTSPLTNECHSAFVDPGATALDNCSGVVNVSTNSTVNANAVGIYTIDYVASDAAGNSATNTRLVYVVDTTPPVITQCAPPQTVTAGYDGLATLADLTMLVVASDACSASVHIAQQPPAGTEISVGVTTVAFYVDDGNGNTNTCSSAVTVNAASLVPPTILSEQVLGDGSFQLTFSGPNGQPYTVLASPDVAAPLAGWLAVTNGNFGASPATFTDPDSPSYPARFYRVRSP